MPRRGIVAVVLMATAAWLVFMALWTAGEVGFSVAYPLIALSLVTLVLGWRFRS